MHFEIIGNLFPIGVADNAIVAAIWRRHFAACFVITRFAVGKPVPVDAWVRFARADDPKTGTRGLFTGRDFDAFGAHSPFQTIEASLEPNCSLGGLRTAIAVAGEMKRPARLSGRILRFPACRCDASGWTDFHGPKF